MPPLWRTIGARLGLERKMSDVGLRITINVRYEKGRADVQGLKDDLRREAENLVLGCCPVKQGAKVIWYNLEVSELRGGICGGGTR
jgi:hypothetical protein